MRVDLLGTKGSSEDGIVQIGDKTTPNDITRVGDETTTSNYGGDE